MNLPKAGLPGKGVSQPAVGEGGCPFESGQVRDDLLLRAGWESIDHSRIGACGFERAAAIVVNESIDSFTGHGTSRR